MNLKQVIGIVGLGYVGLPLALEFAKKYKTIGFDINRDRVDDLRSGIDASQESDAKSFDDAKLVSFTNSLQDIVQCDIYIVTVPTPIDRNNQPDLNPLKEASTMLAKVLSKDDVVIYESTVYPGVTEDVCVPLLAEYSGLKYNEDFFVGYSPERINPGDKKNHVSNIVKITSGSTPEIATKVDDLYRSIVHAGTYCVNSIKVAEAAKLLENVQRDVNIALMNEVYQIFHKLDINVMEVIDAASTKWNFMRVYPGLVGGHCIGVDPYYLLHQSNSFGYFPDIIRTAREVNNAMVNVLLDNFLKKCLKHKVELSKLKILILGYTFKPDCPDTRNTKVEDLYRSMQALDLEVSLYDPYMESEVGQKFIQPQELNSYDIAILAVKHTVFMQDIDAIKASLSSQLIYDFQSDQFL